MSLKALQPRHHAFIAAFRAQGYSNATEAYRQAKFKGKAADVHGPRLLGDPLIRAEVDRLQAEDRIKAERENDLTLEKTRAGLKEALDRAIERKDLNAELRARELLGKTAGHFTDRVETNAQPTAPDSEVLTKLAAVIINALHSAGMLSTQPNIAEKAVVSALQGNGSPHGNIH